MFSIKFLIAFIGYYVVIYKTHPVEMANCNETNEKALVTMFMPCIKKYHEICDLSKVFCNNETNFDLRIEIKSNGKLVFNQRVGPVSVNEYLLCNKSQFRNMKIIDNLMLNVPLKKVYDVTIDAIEKGNSLVTFQGNSSFNLKILELEEDDKKIKIYSNINVSCPSNRCYECDNLRLNSNVQSSEQIGPETPIMNCNNTCNETSCKNNGGQCITNSTCPYCLCSSMYFTYNCSKSILHFIILFVTINIIVIIMLCFLFMFLHKKSKSSIDKTTKASSSTNRSTIPLPHKNEIPVRKYSPGLNTVQPIYDLLEDVDIYSEIQFDSYVEHNPPTYAAMSTTLSLINSNNSIETDDNTSYYSVQAKFPTPGIYDINIYKEELENKLKNKLNNNFDNSLEDDGYLN